MRRRHDCHDCRGEEHGSYGKRRDPHHMPSQPGDEPCTIEQQRREEDDEHKFRVECDCRKVR